MLSALNSLGRRDRAKAILAFPLESAELRSLLLKAREKEIRDPSQWWVEFIYRNHLTIPGMAL